MDKQTNEALLTLAKMIEMERSSIAEAFQTVAERLKAQDKAIIAMSKQIENLLNSYAELMLINGGSNGSK